MFLPLDWDLRLPLEICEMVVDYAGLPPDRGAFDPRSHYRTLRNCSLVCSSWLPRSRRMLYYRVHLQSDTATSLFVRTLAGQPFLADLVQEVEIEGFYQPWITPDYRDRRSSYVPFAQGFLLKHLRHATTLNLYNLDLSLDYPPIYSSLVAKYPIQHLTLWNCSLPLTNIFRMIWSLDNLRSLTLHHDINASFWATPVGAPPNFFNECEMLQRMQSRRPRRCRQLRHLTLGGMYLQSNQFPPAGVFGEHLTQLYLVVQMGKVQGFSRRYGPSLPDQDTTLGLHSDFLRGLLKLEHLHVNVRLAFHYAIDSSMWSDSYPTPQQRIPIPERLRDSYRRFISSVISALSSARFLRIFSFTVVDSFDPRIRPSRSHIVQLLFHQEMQEQLKVISSDALIVVAVDVAEQSDPSEPLNTDEWIELISKSLPTLHGRLHIGIRQRLILPSRLIIYPLDHIEMLSERRTTADTVHAANCKLWLEYATTVPPPPPVNLDAKAWAVFVKSSRYDFRPPAFRVPYPFCPESPPEWENMMLSERATMAESVHDANREPWLEYAQPAPEPPPEWQEMMLSEPGAIAEAVHGANCKLWLENARTVPRPLP